ncbi:MAG: HPF/RaiA family ribosome-associated protein [Azoarcus sp.]|jgi:hypothetical protein|nr:HPF/RaiA family ribosome-associated protein [Azoarcus sp.]
MRIDLRCDDAESPGNYDYIMRRMNAAMARFDRHVRCARIKVANAVSAHGHEGPSGRQGKRCVVQLRLHNLPGIMFAITRLDVRAAVDEAAARTARMLARRLRGAAKNIAHPGMALSRQAWYSPQTEACTGS